MAAVSVETRAAVTKGTLSSRTPGPSPSPPSTRSRRCSGKPPFASCSWSRHSKHQGALWPGRSVGSPCGGFYWWTCRFSRAGASSAAPGPSPPDRTTLRHMWLLCIPADTGTPARPPPSPDTLHDHSGAPCRLEAPVAGHSTAPDILHCTDSCTTVLLARTHLEHICDSDRRWK